MVHLVRMTQTSLSSNGKATAATAKKRGAAAGSTPGTYAAENGNFILGLTLSMSWQMMFAVLLPILGGHFLDKRLDTSPWFTVAGFALAMVLMLVVVRRCLRQLNRYMNLPPVSVRGEPSSKGQTVGSTKGAKQ